MDPTISLLVNIHVATRLHVYGNGIPFEQLRWHEELVEWRTLLNGKLWGQGLHDWDPPRRPSPDPPIGFYKWPTPNPIIFMPLWFPSIIVWFEPTNKLPYWKLQYLTYVKDTNLNVHIKVFKKVIKANRETMKASSTCLVSIHETTSWNGANILYKINPIALLRSWNKHFAKVFELWIMTNKFICNLKTYNNKSTNK